MNNTLSRQLKGVHRRQGKSPRMLYGYRDESKRSLVVVKYGAHNEPPLDLGRELLIKNKISKRVKDSLSLINLMRPRNVRMRAYDKIGARVYKGAGLAPLPLRRLRSIFFSPMREHDYFPAFSAQVADFLLHTRGVRVVKLVVAREAKCFALLLYFGIKKFGSVVWMPERRHAKTGEALARLFVPRLVKIERVVVG